MVASTLNCASTVAGFAWRRAQLPSALRRSLARVASEPALASANPRKSTACRSIVVSRNGKLLLATCGPFGERGSPRTWLSAMATPSPSKTPAMRKKNYNGNGHQVAPEEALLYVGGDVNGNRVTKCNRL